jgi:N-acetylglutamate synthase-like GNAT family acetyltransferase
MIDMGDDTIIIREMNEEDVEGILEIERASKGRHRATTYAPVPDSSIGGEIDYSMVAEDAGRVIGFVLARAVRSPAELGEVAWIEFIGIHPDRQGQGIGTKLIEAWRDRCRQKGIKKVHMMLNWRDWWMQSFFESLGFSRGELVDFQADL